MLHEKTELLSPGGSFMCLQAAINAGADAIYFVAEQLNMRTRSSDPFSVKDIKKVGEFSIETGTVKAGDMLMVSGPACGVVKERLAYVMVTGKKETEAGKGDTITFPFHSKVTANDKLYKIIENA